MKNTNERMRLMVSFLGLLVLLSTAFSMAVMAQAEPITPEDYDGLVILEDPALLGDSEDEGKTESPATEPPVTEVPATETPTTEPTQEPEPTDMPTLEPTALPEAAYKITMVPPEGWYLNRAVMELTITDLNGTGWENVKITLNSLTLIDGELPSGHMWIELLDNCDVMVTVTDPYGQEHNEKVEIRCFDHTAPELRASIQGEFLQVEASDAQSGVAAIQINGTVYDHTSLTNGRLELSLKQYADAYEQLLVQAVDRVGNTSKALALANPFFHNTPAVTPNNTKKPGSSSNNNSGNRATATPTAEPTLAPTVTATAAPYTETESGFPFSGTGNSFTRDLLYDRATNKQFIAIETRNGDLFYMIIDYDKPLDEKGEKYETYFLNLVDSRDLLDIVDAKDIPDEPEVIYVTPEPTEVPAQTSRDEEKSNGPKQDSSKTLLGLAGIAVLSGGGALWYFKQKKGKKRPPVQDYDFESEDEEEETNNGDE
ncbi:MAG: DUF4366 domain-containing protein [Clostridiales bacterium]|nr:DUF4366 domain-containing protein [Clostridiales bacterium]